DLVHRLERGGTLLDAVADNEGRRLIEPRPPLLRAVLVGETRRAVGGKPSQLGLALDEGLAGNREIDVEALGRVDGLERGGELRHPADAARIRAPGDIGGELPPEGARIDGSGK